MNPRQPIPNINIGQVYDQRYADAQVHYDKLSNLAGFFGRNMPVHRHDRFFQVHYVQSGAVRVYLDDQQYLESGPMFFLTPPTIPHAFVTEADSDGHVLTVNAHLLALPRAPFAARCSIRSRLHRPRSEPPARRQSSHICGKARTDGPGALRR